MRKRVYKKSVESKVVALKDGGSSRKAGKVRQVIDGGGVQVGACERPGRCQPSPLRKKKLSNLSLLLGWQSGPTIHTSDR